MSPDWKEALAENPWFCLFVTMMICLLAARFSFDAWRANESSKWQTAVASVVRKDVKRLNGRNYGEIVVTYQFDAEGHKYIGTAEAPFGDLSEIPVVEASFGATLPIYFDPARPANNRIEKGPSPIAWSYAVASGLLALFLACMTSGKFLRRQRG
jgi:hypothetical protein